MKNIYKPGDSKIYRKRVTEADVAAFNGEVVHSVCSTFALAREMEYSSRLFVIDMCDEDEEGIGTFLNINHVGPAFVGKELIIKAIITEFNENELICDIEVKSDGRVVATGKTGQKVLLKEKLNRYFAQLNINE